MRVRDHHHHHQFEKVIYVCDQKSSSMSTILF